MKKIGNELKALRGKLTQIEFAEKFNNTKPDYLRELAQRDISRYERGTVTIPGDILEHMRSM
jgi:transcriptional regulator with XRE-family HTH domain